MDITTEQLQQAIAYIKSKTIYTELQGVKRYVNHDWLTTPSGYAAIGLSGLSRHLDTLYDTRYAREVMNRLEALGIWMPYMYIDQEYDSKMGYYVGKLNEKYTDIT
jgi:hypothetical protein